MKNYIVNGILVCAKFIVFHNLVQLLKNIVTLKWNFHNKYKSQSYYWIKYSSIKNNLYNVNEFNPIECCSIDEGTFDAKKKINVKLFLINNKNCSNY